MIEEVVNSILEAEDVAKRRITEAETTAAEIANNGEIAVEAMRKTAAEQNKTYFAESMAAADVRAGQACNRISRQSQRRNRRRVGTLRSQRRQGGKNHFGAM